MKEDQNVVYSHLTLRTHQPTLGTHPEDGFGYYRVKTRIPLNFKESSKIFKEPTSTSMASPTSNTHTVHKTWSNFYVSKSTEPHGPLSKLNEMPFDIFNNVTQSFTSKPEQLQIFIAGNALNFFVLPGGAKYIRIFHHAFMIAPQPNISPLIIGLYGNCKGTTVFKELSPVIATSPMITTTTSTLRSTEQLPTIEELMQVHLEREFLELVGTSKHSTEELNQWPNIFVLHLAFFAGLDGAKNILAAKPAVHIVGIIQESDDNDEDDESQILNQHSKDPEPSARAKETYRFLLFLSAITKGFKCSVILTDPPDTDMLDDKQAEIHRELDENPQSSTGIDNSATATGTNAHSAALTAALISNLNAVSRAQLDTFGKEERKKSMLSCFSPKAANLFTLLSTTDWTDAMPQLNPFAMKLLANKDPTKALNLIHSSTQNWRGRVCKKGLTQFFSSGYMASNIHLKPSGFTIFMFHPNKTSTGRSAKMSQQAIQAMFGDAKIDDESAKYYSSQDFYLAKNLTDFEGQLETCINFLELMTTTRGIASEGY